MTLKVKSILISLGTTAIFTFIISIIVYQVTMNKFQIIENQRVERNIRRVEAVFKDKLTQIDTKMADWAIWDETYDFLTNKNQAYIDSNLTQESFGASNINEALFIDKNGGLVASFILNIPGLEPEENFPEDVYEHFSTGSALLKINKETGSNKGFLRTEDGLLLFVVRDVVKSDGTGIPAGQIVFARYFDATLLNSMKDLTQFDAAMSLWDNPNIPHDYQLAKNYYLSTGNTGLVKTLDNKTISGYFILKDIDGNPQAIVRTDVGRDIVLQGKSSMGLLALIVGFTSILIAVVNYSVLTKVILKKIITIASEVDDVGSNSSVTRLNTGTGTDEIDHLRENINKMLESIDKSRSALESEKQKGESLIDLIDAIVVTLSNDGNILAINKKGLDTLGYLKEELVGKNWFVTCMSPETKAKFDQRFKDLTAGDIENNATAENEVLTKDGKTLLISWKNTLIKDDLGNVQSTLSLGEDITERKQDELKKEQYAKELEKLNELMVGRELKMVTLKKELDALKRTTS